MGFVRPAASNFFILGLVEDVGRVFKGGRKMKWSDCKYWVDEFECELGTERWPGCIMYECKLFVEGDE